MVRLCNQAFDNQRPSLELLDAVTALPFSPVADANHTGSAHDEDANSTGAVTLPWDSHHYTSGREGDQNPSSIHQLTKMPEGLTSIPQVSSSVQERGASAENCVSAGPDQATPDLAIFTGSNYPVEASGIGRYSQNRQRSATS